MRAKRVTAHHRLPLGHAHRIGKTDPSPDPVSDRIRSWYRCGFDGASRCGSNRWGSDGAANGAFREIQYDDKGSRDPDHVRDAVGLPHPARLPALFLDAGPARLPAIFLDAGRAAPHRYGGWSGARQRRGRCSQIEIQTLLMLWRNRRSAAVEHPQGSQRRLQKDARTI